MKLSQSAMIHLCQWTILSVLVLAGASCVETRVVRSSWEDFAKRTGAQIGGQNTDTKASDAAFAKENQGWTIRVLAFTGSDRYTRATQLVKKLNTESDLQNLWIADQHNRAAVCYGRYQTPDSDAARLRLSDIRLIEFDDQRPFAKAAMIPLSEQNQFYADPLNLKQYTGYYSLQIGYFDQSFGNGYRDAAERMVKSLRLDGEQAYYYHGPFRSHVTVGLFVYEQAFETIENPLAPGTTIDGWSTNVKKLQAKHPHNLANGHPLMQTVDGKPVGAQKSLLIRVPS